MGYGGYGPFSVRMCAIAIGLGFGYIRWLPSLRDRTRITGTNVPRFLAFH